MNLPLDQLSAPARQVVEESFQRLEAENRLLREQVRLLQIAKFGRSSERLTDNQLTMLEGEPSVTRAEVETEAAVAQSDPAAAQARPPQRQRKPNENHPGRAALPAHLERREVVISCEPGQCHCGICGKANPVIGYEVCEELDVDPAQYFVRVTKREKRACREHPEGKVTTAACPEKIIPKSKLSDALIIDSVIKKFADHVPVYRYCVGLMRDAGVEISRGTLVEAMMKVGALLDPIRQMLRKDLLAGGYIQADETPTPCQSERTKGKNHQAYMWEFSRPGGPVVFDFRMGRSREGPAEFLRNFEGTLQCDGYSAYDKLGQGIGYAGCWAHVRRAFHQAHLLAPADLVPLELLDRIGKLYQVEEQAREQELSAAQRLALRQEKSRPLMTSLQERITQVRQSVLPKSKLGKACDYALGQWERLLVFLGDGRIEIDNNWCENAIRPIALGRKNWLHIGSEQAGPKIAAIASITETCRRLSINLRAYLTDVLPKLPEWPISRIAELSPLIWKPSK